MEPDRTTHLGQRRFRGLAVLALLLAACAPKPYSNVPPQRTLGGAVPLVVPGFAAEPHRPLAVLIERNPWISVLGADVPTVAVYADGLVIRNDIEHHRVVRRQGRLSPRALAGLLDGLRGGGLLSLPPRMWSSGATDQPSVEIMVRAKGESEDLPRWYFIHAYGVARSGKPTVGEGASSDAPEAFTRAYQALLTLPAREPWKPDAIEVLIADFSSAVEPPLPWPASVPAPDPACMGGRSAFMHIVPGAHEAALTAHLDAGGRSRPTSLAGRRWQMDMRIRVPAQRTIDRIAECGHDWSWATLKNAPSPACEALPPEDPDHACAPSVSPAAAPPP